MRKSFLAPLCCALCAAFSLFSQTRSGFVREFNENGRPLAGVRIEFEGAPPAVSDANGIFNITFKGKSTDDYLNLLTIDYPGYEIANLSELRELTVGGGDLLETPVLLARQGVLAAAEAHFYGLGHRVLTEAYEQKMKTLEQSLAQKELSQQDYRTGREALEYEYENRQTSLLNFVNLCAHADLNRADSLHRSALAKLASGRIGETLVLLEQADLTRLPAPSPGNLKKEVRLRRESRLKSLTLLATLYELRLEDDKAAGLFERLLQADSTRLDVLEAAAASWEFKNAENLYAKIAAHPEATPHRIADAYFAICRIHFSDAPEAALAACQKALDLLGHLPENARKSALIQTKIANANYMLGYIYQHLNKLDTALLHLEAAHTAAAKWLNGRLSDPDLDISDAAINLVLARTLKEQEEPARALAHAQKAVRLLEKLQAADAGTLRVVPILAGAYNSVGDIHGALEQWDQALAAFTTCDTMLKTAFARTPVAPANKWRSLALAAVRKAETEEQLERHEAALNSYREYLNWVQALYNAHPEDEDLTNELAVAHNRVGEMYAVLEQHQKSLPHFENFFRLSETLCKIDPENEGFKFNLTLAHECLGDTYRALKRTKEALPHYEAVYRENKARYDANTDDLDAAEILAALCEKLAETRAEAGLPEQAAQCYREAERLRKNLLDTNSDDPALNHAWALVQYKIGAFQRDFLKNPAQARVYFLQAERVWKSIATEGYRGYLGVVQDDLRKLK